jgi:hypothetical protein
MAGLPSFNSNWGGSLGGGGGRGGRGRGGGLVGGFQQLGHPFGGRMGPGRGPSAPPGGRPVRVNGGVVGAGQNLAHPFGYGNGSAPPGSPGAAPPPGSGGGGPPGAAPPSGPPLDSTYYLNVGQSQFGMNQKINALNQQGGYATEDLQSALAKLSYAQPRAELAQEQAANRQGGLYSSVYNQNLANMNYNYLGQKGGLQQGYDRGVAQRASDVAGLRGGENLYEIGQAYDSTQRATNAAAANPAIGLAPPAAPGAAGGKSGSGGTTGKGGKGATGGKGAKGGKGPTFKPGPLTRVPNAPRPTGGVGLPYGGGGKGKGGRGRSTGGYGIAGGGG